MAANKEIRDAIEKKRLRHYEVAQAMGVCYTYFSHLLQTELPQERKDEILEVIRNYEL